MGEYTANMTALGQRLQTVEKLAEQRQEILTDDKPKQKNTLDVTVIGTSEDDV
jgi:hypothetical protein